MDSLKDSGLLGKLECLITKNLAQRVYIDLLNKFGLTVRGLSLALFTSQTVEAEISKRIVQECFACAQRVSGMAMPYVHGLPHVGIGSRVQHRPRLLPNRMIWQDKKLLCMTLCCTVLYPLQGRLSGFTRCFQVVLDHLQVGISVGGWVTMYVV